jgi:hypothetical protein
LFVDIAVRFNLIFADTPRKFSNNAKLVGGKLFEKFIKLLGEHEILDDIEYYTEEEQNVVVCENMPSTSKNIPDELEDYEPPKQISTHKVVPYDTKLKIVLTAQEHPQWSFKTLKHHFRKYLNHPSDVTKYKKAVLSGGTFRDKLNTIKTNVYDRFTEARNKNQLVTRRLLQQWAIAAAAQYNKPKEEQDSEEHTNVFHFVASSTWLTNFLHDYRISNRRVVRYVSKKEAITPEVVIKSAKQFQTLIQAISPDYDPDFVINTDQTGCEYRVNVSRTYTHTGEKLVQLYIGDLNKVSHSYTAQYSLTKSGKLLNKVFVCLQEFSDNFGVRVQKDVDELLELCKNVVITCSKSGKLTTSLYAQYLENVVKPYVGDNLFLFIVDSWGGQKNIQMYNEIFRDKNNKPTCNLQIIPPKCTPICQPCDVYFYRQVKVIIKKIQNCPDVISQSGDESKQLNTRADAIRIQSLTHYLLSAPKFKCMLQFAWYASKLADDREIFLNVNQLCFPSNIYNKTCVCGQHNSFIKCSWCEKILCFQCFYINFHPQHCEAMETFYRM